MGSEEENNEFYLRYYVGHKGKFGHEFLEFEFRPDGKLRYANNSNYKNDTIIRKEVYLTPAVLRECRRIISESEVTLIYRLTNYVNPLSFFFCVWIRRCLVSLLICLVCRLWRKMITTGRNRTGWGDRSWRLLWGMNTYRSRPRKLDLWWMFRAVLTRKDFVSFTTLFRWNCGFKFWLIYLRFWIVHAQFDG